MSEHQDGLPKRQEVTTTNEEVVQKINTIEVSVVSGPYLCGEVAVSARQGRNPAKEQSDDFLLVKCTEKGWKVAVVDGMTHPSENARHRILHGKEAAMAVVDGLDEGSDEGKSVAESLFLGEMKMLEFSAAHKASETQLPPRLAAVVVQAELKGNELTYHKWGDAMACVIRDGEVVDFVFPDRDNFIGQVQIGVGTRDVMQKGAISEERFESELKDVHRVAASGGGKGWDNLPFKTKRGDIVVVFSDGYDDLIQRWMMKDIYDLTQQGASHAEVMRLIRGTPLGNIAKDCEGDPGLLVEMMNGALHDLSVDEALERERKGKLDDQSVVAARLGAPCFWGMETDLREVLRVVNEFGGVETSGGQVMEARALAGTIKRARELFRQSGNKVTQEYQQVIFGITRNGGLRDKVDELISGGQARQRRKRRD